MAQHLLGAKQGSKKKLDTPLKMVWTGGEYMSEDYPGHLGPFWYQEKNSVKKTAKKRLKSAKWQDLYFL